LPQTSLSLACGSLWRPQLNAGTLGGQDQTKRDAIARPATPKECSEAIALIAELYAVERRANTGPAEERARLRNEESRTIVKRIEQRALSVHSLPGYGLRNAIEYVGGMWNTGLLRFLDVDHVPIDNNGPSAACAASWSAAKITTALARHVAPRSLRSSTA
jgi:hypothetical protein